MGDGHTPQRIGIIGLGVIGGSLARSLKASAAIYHITAYSVDPHDTDLALREGAVDVVATSAEACARAQDLVIYAVPLDATTELLRAHSGIWGQAAVTDVASLKAPVMAALRGTSGAKRFVGSHPIAGCEGSGFGRASERLFASASVCLTAEACDADALAMVTALWEGLGARPQVMDADEHDARMVWVSHAPQLVSNVLARVLARAGLSRDDLGPGGRDMTRLAASSPEMWKSLVASAAAPDATALRAVAAECEELASSLDTGDVAALTRLMNETCAWREDA